MFELKVVLACLLFITSWILAVHQFLTVEAVKGTGDYTYPTVTLIAAFVLAALSIGDKGRV